MAMSLEDLLAEEGFKRRKEKMKGRASFASHDRQESASLLSVRRTDRTRSDIPHYDSKAEFSTSSSFSGRKPRDNFTRREKMDRDQLADKGTIVVNNGRRSHVGSLDANRFSIASEITEVDQSDGIVEEGMKIVHYNDKREGKKDAATSFEGKETYKNDIMMDSKKDKNNSFKHTYPQAAQGNKFNESRSIRQNKVDEVEAAPALDEAAIKAIISIFSGHAKRFLDDEDFRISLHHNTLASLNLTGVDTESKVVENLEQAIETIERASEESATLKELKRASLQLSVITGLNSDDLKDGFTSGVPNLRLSASAHLYLSIIYVLQKKDKVAAKHLLQVFCNSPFQARTILLPDLWDHVFLPHLLPLKVWYDKETHTAADSPIFVNMKLLNTAYNESLDSGTHQFAMYYKDWMIDGVEAPSIPLISIPSFSVQLMLRGGGILGHTSSPASHVSPQPMVSKQLYDEVFKHKDKPAVESQLSEEEEEEEEEEENFDSSAARSSNSPAPEDKQLILCIHDKQVEPVRESPTETDGEVMQKDELEPPLREFREKYEYCIGKPFDCRIPEDFICPLTGLVFNDPVTLETGETFEHEAIVDWFSKGCFTCPVTRKALQYQAVPPTNLILKRIIYRWKTGHIEHLLALLSKVASGSGENLQVNDDNSMMVCILGQLLPVFSKEEKIIHARRLVSVGGLQFLLKRFDSSNVQEKTFILALLCCCIDADAGCRNWIAREINQSNLLEMLRSELLTSRKNAVLLLTELICFNRRSRAKWFLDGVGDEEILNALDDMSIYLQTCPLEQTPLVAILVLHLDLLSDRGHSSKIYREEAVDALTTALMRSLTDSDDDKVLQNKCCKALLILGGFFSSSGKLMTEDWILKLAGFLNCPDWDNDTDTALDGTITTVDSVREDIDDDEEEESARDKWLTSLSASLVSVGDGKKSLFLEAVSKCLSSGKSTSDLVRVCLTTVAWLSFSLANSLHVKHTSTTQTQYELLSAFSALISPLNQYLQRGVLVEQRILASLSLLNFTTIPECRILVMKIGDEIGSSIDDLAEVTWTASELYTIIYGQTKGGTT